MTTKAELLKVIKLQCQECMGSSVARNGELDGEAANLVIGCTAPDCSLFPFRSGKDPWPSKSKVEGGRKLGVQTNYTRKKVGQISTI